MRNVIVYMTEEPEVWGSLKRFCKAKNLSYNTYSRKEMPFKVEGYTLYKTKLQNFKEKNSMDAEIKACPFCKKTPHAEKMKGFHVVTCLSCKDAKLIKSISHSRSVSYWNAWVSKIDNL